MSQTLNVHVRVSDGTTRRPTSVRIRIAGPDGTYYPPLGRSAEFPLGRNENVGGHVYLNGQRYAYIDGGAEFPLPTGVPLAVEISKGPAYFPVREEVTLAEGQLTLRFAVWRWLTDRWSDLVAADTRCHFLSPHSARLEAGAEGLNFVNLLAVVQDFPASDGHMYRTIPNVSAISGQAPALDGVYVNTLNVHPALGRLGLLNCHRTVYPLTSGQVDETDDWSLADWCDQCHRKHGLVVWTDAYRQSAGLAGGEALIDAILGKVDAIELDAHERTGPLLPFWYRLLDAGIRLPIVGGSGKDGNRIALGGVRTLTPPDGGVYSAWVDRVRAGRTVVTNGPYLRLEIDGEPFPTRLNQDSARPVRLRATAESVVPFERLELIANGLPVAMTNATGGNLCSATLEIEHTLPMGGWVVARCWGMAKSTLFPHVPVFAHTSPAWVEVDGRPISRKPAAVIALLREIAEVRLWVETTGRFTIPKRKDHLLALCDAAAEKLAGAP